MSGLRVPEKALRWTVLAGIALLLVTPFVVTPGTIFPFTVGKAMWSRSLVEIVFALWAVLALARPQYRPPRSWLLLLLAAGLAVALFAACFGVSVERSLWSNYERMQGVVDGAHWFVLAVVLASMLRTGGEWRALLGLNAGLGVAMAALVIARRYGLDVPFYGEIPEPERQRMSGPFGNPLYLGACMLFNLMIALGFAVRAWLPAARAPAAAAVPAARPGRRRRRRRKAPARPAPRPEPRWPRGAAWTTAVALLLWGLALAGSVGVYVGLFAAISFVALAYTVLARARGRWIALAALAVLGLSAVGTGLRFVDADRTTALATGLPYADRVTSVHLQRPSVQSRLAAWQAGLEGFAARPVLGWGPENFGAVFGRFASGYGATAVPHDRAHSKLVEVAATTGVLGLVAWLALWATAFVVLWRAARAMEVGERVMAVFAGGALFGTLVQSLSLFDTAIGLLQSMLLLGFVVSLEAAAVPEHRRPRMPAWMEQAGAALLCRGRVRTALGVAAAALAATGLAANHAISGAADVSHLPRAGGSYRDLAGGIDGFRPLANTWRWRLFDELAQNWPRLRTEDGARARGLLEWAGREAGEAVRTEPGHWRIAHSLARMYGAAAKTDPEYGAKARQYMERARDLAPNRAVFPSAPASPGGLGVRELPDGRHELRWRWPEGAGYIVVTESRDGGRGRTVLHRYDPVPTSFVPPGPRSAGTWRYRIKACLYPGACSAVVWWPPIVVPAGGVDRGSEP